ncbi:MAG: Fe-S cluster assembly protein SufD [Actinomycetota bacterium]
MGFSRQDVEGLSASLSEPGWVTDRRLQSWDWFEKLELPAEKEEQWRYTNLARLKFKLDPFAASAPGADRQAPAPNVETGRSAIFVQEGSSWAPASVTPEVASSGVIVSDIHTAIAEHPDLVRPNLFAQVDSSSHIFAALHGALFCGGTFVYVPRGVKVALPIEARYRIGKSGTIIAPHTLIVAEEGAEVAYIQRYGSAELDERALSDAALEVVAGQNCRVHVVTMQEYERNAWHFEMQGTSAQRDTNLRSLVVTLGGTFSRTETTSTLLGEGITMGMTGLYLAGEGQHFDFRTLQDHHAAHCMSDLLYKGALRNNAHTVYSGLIHVRPEGAETDAYQTNRNLVLSDHAKADSKPELEIENNDVRCSHAASVGQIDENEIFYLQSRGIDRELAKQLIVKGFLEEVLSRVVREDVRDLVKSALEARLQQ